VVKTKGTGIVILRKLFETQPPERLELFLSKLTPAQQHLFKSVMPVHWVELTDEVGGLFDQCAQVLFPQEKEPSVSLGLACAKLGISFFYKMFFLVLTPQFVFGEVAAYWRLFWDVGKAEVAREARLASENVYIFRIKDFIPMNQGWKQYMNGYIRGFGEMAGAKNLKVVLITDQPELLEWRVTWKRWGA
jgi:hypothetical protein